MYTDVYTGSLQTQSCIQSSQKPLRNSTKQSHLDHLHHNQRSDLDPLKTHTSLGQHTNTKNADLGHLKNTQHFSANTQSFFQQIQGLHLLQNQIWNQYKRKSYLTLFDQTQSLSNLNSFKISKTCVLLKTKLF